MDVLEVQDLSNNFQHNKAQKSGFQLKRYYWFC